MRQCQIRVRFESRVKTKFLEPLNQIMKLKFWFPWFPCPNSFQKKYDIYMHKDVQKERNWDNVNKNCDFAWKFRQNVHFVVAWHHFSLTLMTINHKVLYIFGNVLTWRTSEWLWFIHFGFAFQEKGWWIQKIRVKWNYYFDDILGKRSAPRIKIIQKEPL